MNSSCDRTRFVAPSHALDHSFICASSSWEVAACWQPTGLPLAVDKATIGVASGNGAQVQYTAISGTRSVNALVVDGGQVNTLPTLRQSGGDLTAAFETKGQFSGGYAVQSGGVTRVGTLVLGSQAIAMGRYDVT
jgi:hypothetical protein